MNERPDSTSASPIHADTKASASDRRTGIAPDRDGSWQAEPDGLVKTTVRGYRRGSSLERAGLGMLASFAATIGLSRLVNYVRERRRNAPRVRSWGRHAYHAPGRERLRVHHFIPGIGLMLVSGAAAILTRNENHEFWFSLPFGTGAGLALDEIAVLTELDNPYWESEKLATAQAASAALGALALAIRLHHHGRHSQLIATLVHR